MPLCFLFVTLLQMCLYHPCLSSGILGMAPFSFPALTAPRVSLNNQAFCFSPAATTPALDFSAARAAYTGQTAPQTPFFPAPRQFLKAQPVSGDCLWPRPQIPCKKG